MMFKTTPAAIAREHAEAVASIEAEACDRAIEPLHHAKLYMRLVANQAYSERLERRARL